MTRRPATARPKANLGIRVMALTSRCDQYTPVRTICRGAMAFAPLTTTMLSAGKKVSYSGTAVSDFERAEKDYVQKVTAKRFVGV